MTILKVTTRFEQSIPIRILDFVGPHALQETFKVECDILKQEYTDTSLDIQAEYVSQETMRDEWGWSETFAVYYGFSFMIAVYPLNKSFTTVFLHLFPNLVPQEEDQSLRRLVHDRSEAAHKA